MTSSSDCFHEINKNGAEVLYYPLHCVINLPAASSVGTTIPQFTHWRTDKADFFEEWMNVYMPLPFYLCPPLHSMLLLCTVAEDTT